MCNKLIEKYEKETKKGGRCIQMKEEYELAKSLEKGNRVYALLVDDNGNKIKQLYSGEVVFVSNGERFATIKRDDGKNGGGEYIGGYGNGWSVVRELYKGSTAYSVGVSLDEKEGYNDFLFLKKGKCGSKKKCKKCGVRIERYSLCDKCEKAF